MTAQTSPGAPPITTPAPTFDDFDRCEANEKLIMVEGEDGGFVFRFVARDDPGFLEWAFLSYCNPTLAPFLSRFELTTMVLGSAAPPAYSQDQIDAMIAQARPIGGDLVEAQRRQWEQDDSCEHGGRPFADVGTFLPITPLPAPLPSR